MVDEVPPTKATSPSTPSAGPSPALHIDSKWDRVIDISLRRVVYGTAFGGLAALLFFRGPSARMVVTSFAAGAGMGSAWQQCSKEFAELVPSSLR